MSSVAAPKIPALVGVQAAEVAADLGHILDKAGEDIVDVFKRHGVPAEQHNVRLIMTMLGAAVGTYQACMKICQKLGIPGSENMGLEDFLSVVRQNWRDVAPRINENGVFTGGVGSQKS